VKGGKLNGYATVTYANGDVFEGDVVDGEASGVGTMKLAAGGKFVGEFKKGVFHGRGAMYDADNKLTLQSYWTNGKIAGK